MIIGFFLFVVHWMMPKKFIDLLSWEGKFGQHSSSVIWDVVVRLLWSIWRERGMRFSMG